MAEIQMENEKPLLVVRYVWWRVLYTQIWNLIFIGIGSIIFVGDCTYMKCLIDVLLLIIWIFGVYSFIEMLLFKQLSFYHDRIVKTYNLFGDRVFYFTNKTILRKSGALSGFIAFAYDGELFAKMAIPIQAIGTGQAYSQLLSILSVISQRNVLEFENVVFTINPLIKQTPQGK